MLSSFSKLTANLRHKMASKAENAPVQSSPNTSIEGSSQGGNALVNPMVLTGGNHMLDAPPWDVEKEKVCYNHKKDRYDTLTNAGVEILLDPYEYLLQHPGKDIRTLLIKAFDVWLKVPPASLEIISKVVAMLHTASLLYVKLSFPQ